MRKVEEYKNKNKNRKHIQYNNKLYFANTSYHFKLNYL